jgi:hypothetical protein
MLQPLYPQRKNALRPLNRRVEGCRGDRSKTFTDAAVIGKGICGIGVERWDRVVSVQWEGDLWDWS